MTTSVSPTPTASPTLFELSAEIQAMEARKRKYMSEQKDAIGEAIRSFVQKHSGVIKAVTWTQYTPYFNDGDPCTFSVHEPEVVLLDGDDRCINARYFKYSFERGTLKKTPELEAMIEDFKALTDALAPLEDLFLHAFGDHVEVTVTVDEVTVDDYSHD